MALLAALWTFGAFADDPRTLREPHEPFTFKGFRVRSNIEVAVPSLSGSYTISMGPALFQEISPCRFVSTLAEDLYPAPWGGPAFHNNEARYYTATGTMRTADWQNPCEYKVPAAALAVAMRIYTLNGDGEGAIYASPAHWNPTAGLRVLPITPGQPEQALPLRRAQQSVDVSPDPSPRA
jgi:hypothetical protein